MITALNISKTITHVLDKDPDKGTDKATVFHLRAIPARVMANIRDRSMRYVITEGSEEAQTQIASNQAMLEMVAFAVTAIDNFSNDDGSAVEIKKIKKNIGGKTYEVLDESVVGLLDLEYVQELSTKIRDINVVSDETKKKSEEQSSEAQS